MNKFTMKYNKLVFCIFAFLAVLYAGTKPSPRNSMRTRFNSENSENEVVRSYDSPTVEINPTNLFHFTSISCGETTVSVTIATPWQGTLKFFGTTNLLEETWDLLATSLVSSNETSMCFSNITAHSYFIRAKLEGDDFDGDGISNIWETEMGLNPFSALGVDGANGDEDFDGLTNEQEYNLSTNPKSSDSDNDGYFDDEEILLNQSPLVPNVGATLTIRYYYDDDNQLIGTYLGDSKGASLQSYSKAGNTISVREKSCEERKKGK